MPSGAELLWWGLFLLIPALITGACAVLIPKGGAWAVTGVAVLTVSIILDRLLSRLYHRALYHRAAGIMDDHAEAGDALMQDVRDIRARRRGGIEDGGDDVKP